MASTISEVTIESNEETSIQSPTWQTSGITGGMQVLAGTGALPFWTGEPSTAIKGIDEYPFIIKVEEDEISNLLLKDEQFRESINRAREQIRKGEPYLKHSDVFGE